MSAPASTRHDDDVVVVRLLHAEWTEANDGWIVVVVAATAAAAAAAVSRSVRVSSSSPASAAAVVAEVMAEAAKPNPIGHVNTMKPLTSTAARLSLRLRR